MFLHSLRLPPQIAEYISGHRNLPASSLPEQHNNLGQAPTAFPTCSHASVLALCSRLLKDMLGMGLPRKACICQVGELCVENWTTKVKLPLPISIYSSKTSKFMFVWFMILQLVSHPCFKNLKINMQLFFALLLKCKSFGLVFFSSVYLLQLWYYLIA